MINWFETKLAVEGSELVSNTNRVKMKEGKAVNDWYSL